MPSRKPVLQIFKIITPFLVVIILNIAPTPWNLQRSFHAAYTAQQDDRLAHSVVPLKTIIEYQPWRQILWEQVAWGQVEGGECMEAIPSFLKARDAGLLSLDGRIALGDAYSCAGLSDSAIQTWYEAVRQGGSPDAAYSRIYHLQRQANDLSGALKTLQTWFENSPQDSWLAFELGSLLSSLDPYQAAVPLEMLSSQASPYKDEAETLLEAIKSLPSEPIDLPYALLSSGRALATLDKWDLAKVAFETALQLNPRYGEAWAFLGEAQQRLGEDGKASLDKAYQLDSHSLLVQSMLALYWKRQNSPEISYVFFHNLAEMEPEQATWQIEMGDVMAELGNINSAIEYYHQATEVDPQNPTAWSKLALFSLNNNLAVREQALPAARQLVVLTPADPFALDLMGVVLSALQDYTGAERFFNRALSIDPQYASSFLHMAQMNLNLQNTHEAYSNLLMAVCYSDEHDSTGMLARRILLRTFGTVQGSGQ